MNLNKYKRRELIDTIRELQWTIKQQSKDIDALTSALIRAWDKKIPSRR